MRKLVLLGTAMALAALLVCSCTKNRFDFDHIDSVEGSGQWKLPIGSLNVTLGDVLSQLAENDLVSHDANGNLQIAYKFSMDDILRGSQFMSLNDMAFEAEFEFENPYPGIQLPNPVDTVITFQQSVILSSDGTRLKTARIKSGTLQFALSSDMNVIQSAVISSSGIIFPDGSYLVTNGELTDLSGAFFDGEELNDTLQFTYEFHCTMTEFDGQNYGIQVVVGIHDLEIEELSGYLDPYPTHFVMDTSFSLPLDNFDGELSLVGTQVRLSERNTLGLTARLQVATAELYGEGANPSWIFKPGTTVDIIPTSVNHYALDTTFTLTANTRHDAFRIEGDLILNPNGLQDLVYIYDTSSISLGVSVLVPFRFNIPGVHYFDTLDLNISDFSTVDLISEVRLTIAFDSKMPFNLGGQVFTYNSTTGQITDSILSGEQFIGASFDGNPVRTESVISMTQERLSHLMDADKLIMRLGVDTENNDVQLNLNDGFGMIIKADVIYGGEIDINN